jgi:hypothetical protein
MSMGSFGVSWAMAKAAIGVALIFWVSALAIRFGWRPKVRERMRSRREQRELENSATDWAAHVRSDRDQRDDSSGRPPGEGSSGKP